MAGPEKKLNVTEFYSMKGIPGNKKPSHVAIIMDGNGRWAQEQGLPRIEGHRRGVDTVRMICETSIELGIDTLTLYCLSSENWNRPDSELSFLLSLLENYLIEERPYIIKNEIRFRSIGRRDRLPTQVLRELDKTVELSACNSGTKLVLAIDYGGRNDLVRAFQKLLSEVVTGKMPAEDVSESVISQFLDTAGMADPDLLIRTGGEMRVSNFLLWQISYSEIWVTTKRWPEFTKNDFFDAMTEYASRQRRFGGIVAKNSDICQETTTGQERESC